MERKTENTTNLDNILFYSGQYAKDAAEMTVARAFESSLAGLGQLSKTEDGLIYWSRYPNVLYKERDTIINNIGDLYTETLSYITSTDPDYSTVGNTYISNNRYNVIYTYETDLNNNFDTAKWIVRDHLVDFLKGINRQTFNKQGFYNGEEEISSIKIDQTYFKWFPADSVAYVNTIDASYDVTHHEFFVNEIPNNQYIYDTENVPEDVAAYLNSRGGLAEGEYLHANTTIEHVTYTYDVPYIIGDNYYSYVKHVYCPIDDTLNDKINSKLEVFENKYNPDIYAYYIYDCNCDLPLLLTSKSVGVKQSLFKIGFDSKFSNWFGNTIDINVNLNSDTNIGGTKYEEGETTNTEEFEPLYKMLDITSANDGEIFSVFKNKSERISGSNVTLLSNHTHSFYSNSELTFEDSLNILTPYEIDTLDLSPLEFAMGPVLNLNENEWTKRDCKMRALILHCGNDIVKSNLERIYGLNDLTTLEYVNIENHNKLKVTPAIDKLTSLKVFEAKGSSIDSFRPFHNLTLNHVSLPSTIKSIKLIGNKFEEGIINIKGEDKYFTGTFDYIPNSTLSSLSLRRIDDTLSYNLVKDWYTVLKNEGKLDSVIYLELEGINWNDVPVDTLLGIKKFDLSPSFSGSISILGSGNYHKLSRSDYQNITKLYGINAFVAGQKDNKVFKNLDITSQIEEKETFEFSLTVTNKTIQDRNTEYEEYKISLGGEDYITNEDYIEYVKSTENKIDFIDTLNVEFNQYDYNFVTKDYTTIGDPYSNRAANALLDMIYSGKNSFRFVKDDIDKYIYCNLDTSIDTSSSTPIKKVKKGDILLFNGDTLMIFFEDQPDNSIFEYIKLGNIIDQNSTKDIFNMSSNSIVKSSVPTIENWFNEFDEFVLEFTPSEREKVINGFNIEGESILYQGNFDGINISVDISDEDKENLSEIEVKNCIINYDQSLLTVTSLTEDENTYPRTYNIKYKSGIDFTNPINTVFSVYSPIEPTLSKANYKITLKDFFYETEVNEENELVLDSSNYTIENNTLIVPGDSIYIPEERMLIIK